jgi:signal peptidase I
MGEPHREADRYWTGSERPGDPLGRTGPGYGMPQYGNGANQAGWGEPQPWNGPSHRAPAPQTPREAPTQRVTPPNQPRQPAHASPPRPLPANGPGPLTAVQPLVPVRRPPRQQPIPEAAPATGVIDRSRRKTPAKKLKGGRRRLIKPVKLSREIPLLIVVALGLALLIKTFLVQAFFIPSQSMQNTINPGDRVLVNKLSPWFGWVPKRGEVVVFHDPGGWLSDTGTTTTQRNPVVGGFENVLTYIGLLPSSSEHDLIKRVIGVPGDHVTCCDAQGRITVDGVPLAETGYLFPGAAPSTIKFNVTVPAGKVWVMGDNRGDSADSRFHLTDRNGPFVPESDIVGPAFVRIWPLNRIGLLSVPATFAQQGLQAFTALGTTSATPAAVLAAAMLFWGGPRRRRTLDRGGLLRRHLCTPRGRDSRVSRAFRGRVRVRCRRVRRR